VRRRAGPSGIQPIHGVCRGAWAGLTCAVAWTTAPRVGVQPAARAHGESRCSRDSWVSHPSERVVLRAHWLRGSRLRGRLRVSGRRSGSS
jgi:hypothetical protein